MRKTILKYLNRIVLVISITASVLFFTSGCQSREDTSIVLDDSTIVYPSKSENGIYAKITFSNKISKKTGKPLRTGTVFKLQKKAKVYATIKFEEL